MFDYTISPKQIRQTPDHHRASARLMLVNRSTQRIHNLDAFSNIINHLSENDVIFINNTKVIPARLTAHKPSGGKVEVMIERILDKNNALALVKSNGKLSPGQQLFIDKTHELSLKSLGEICHIELKSHGSIEQIINDHGQTPLPPYLERKPSEIDLDRYQTVYAKYPGAVAAPTAGLHFDHELISNIKAKGISIVPITLHVGAGTFKPLKPGQTKLHEEIYHVSPEAADQWHRAKKDKKRIIAVGTTTMRTLESWCKTDAMEPGTYPTRLWIKPGFHFQAVDALITNFHLPQTSLLDLVEAFAGDKLIQQAYQEAIRQQYHFYSYGDAMMIYA